MGDSRKWLLVFGVFLFVAPQVTHAFDVRVEPVVGYQLARKSNPERTTKTITYGGRLVAGVTLLSAEAEYNRGASDESFSDGAVTIKETTERYRLGLRSDIRAGLLSFFRVRAGAEGRKITTDRTDNGVARHTVSPTKVFPYVGAGVGMAVAPKIRVIAEVTATVIDQKDWKKNEISPSLSVSLGL